MKNQLNMFPERNLSELSDIMIDELLSLDRDELISELNNIREKLHKISPFKKEPVDFVKWVKNDMVTANDYNPNSVALRFNFGKFRGYHVKTN